LSGSRKITTLPTFGQRPTSGSTRSQSPGWIAGSIEASVVRTRQGPRRRSRRERARVTGRGSARSAVDAGLLLAAGGLPSRVDLVDQVEELLRLGDVGRGLDLRDLLVCLPEEVVQVRDLVEVLRLEIVVPEDVEVVLDQVGALFLDMNAARPECNIIVRVVLVDDLVDRLGLDPGLLRVVHATW